MLLEKKDQLTKLESRLRRVEEDILMTKNEITAEVTLHLDIYWYYLGIFDFTAFAF